MAMVICMCKSLQCRMAADDERHGTPNGHINYRCHCEPCRAAWVTYRRQRKEVHVAAGIPEHLHGSATCYGDLGCRCRLCIEAWAAYNQRLRHRKIAKTSSANE